jgi:hypothetical protein
MPTIRPDDRKFVEATDRAIAHVVADFQAQPDRFWNERDIHWHLFYYLRLDSVFLRDYGPEPIRAEFPTRRVYSEEARPARGHYDLVILDPTSVTGPPVSRLPPWASWEEYLPHVVVLVAIEVKTWVDKTTNIPEKVDWDIDKLTDPSNAVRQGYFLNFVQLDFSRQPMLDFYRDLREYLMKKAKQWPKLRILYVPHDKRVESDPREIWI